MNNFSDSTTQTRKNLLEAFWRLYKCKRIEQITVREITELAGYNRGTFYVYFRDVYDVLNQIEENVLVLCEDSLVNCAQIGIAYTDPKQIVEIFFWLYEDGGDHLGFLLSKNGDPYFTGKFKDTIRPIFRDMLVIRGKLAPETGDYTLEYMLSALLGVLNLWFEKGKTLPIEQLSEHIYFLMLENGLKKYFED